MRLLEWSIIEINPGIASGTDPSSSLSPHFMHSYAQAATSPKSNATTHQNQRPRSKEQRVTVPKLKNQASIRGYHPQKSKHISKLAKPKGMKQRNKTVNIQKINPILTFPPSTQHQLHAKTREPKHALVQTSPAPTSLWLTTLNSALSRNKQQATPTKHIPKQQNSTRKKWYLKSKKEASKSKTKTQPQ